MTDRLSQWADANRGLALDVVRIYLGVGLVVRGLTFLIDPETYLDLVGTDAQVFTSFVAVHYVALAHVGAGLLLTLGLLTRLAALVQIPILAVATFAVHWPGGLFEANQSFAFSALVLVLLGVIAVWGGGPWSLDRRMRGWNEAEEADDAERVAAHAREVRARGRAPRRAPERGPVPTDAPAPCTHERGRDHPRVEAERTYGASRIRFLFGTHPLPTAVTFRCRDCGGVVGVETDPAALEAYRYRRAGTD